MELRPRKGRSTQPPSTPSSVMPSPGPRAPLSSRKKPALPATSINVSSDDEDEDQKETDNGMTKKQGNKERIAAENHDFHTPLSSVATKHRVRSSIRKVASSDARKKTKVNSSIKKKVDEVESIPAALQNYVNVADSGLDEASTGNNSKIICGVALEKKVLVEASIGNATRASNGTVSSETTLSAEVFTENVSRVSSDVSAEKTELDDATIGNVSRVSNEVSLKKIVVTEVSGASSKGKKVQSSKKKSARKRDETNQRLFEDTCDGAVEHEFTEPKLDEIHDDQARTADVGASAAHSNDYKNTGFTNEVKESGSLLSPMPLEDETAQALDAMEVDGRNHEVLTVVSNEVASRKHVQAEAFGVSSKGKKAQSSKKVTKKRGETYQNFVEDTYHGSVDYEDTEHEDQARHATVSATECKGASLSNGVQESESLMLQLRPDMAVTLREGDGRDQGNVHHGESEQRVSRNERHGGRPLGGSFKEREAVELKMQECDGDKLDRFHTGTRAKADVNQSVQAASKEASYGKAAPRQLTDDDTINSQDDTREDNHKSAKGHFNENVVLSNEEDSESADNEDEEDDSDHDDEEEMAKLFVRSMKAHMQQTCEPSVVSIQKEMQAKSDGLEEEENVYKKAAVEGFQLVSGSSSRSTSFGCSWSPETGLLTSKTVSAQTESTKCIMKGMPDTIWRKEGKLQDGLFVPPVDPLKLNKLARKQKDNTAGSKWFNLSAPTITPEIKKELQLLKLRGVVDPKRHYKADDSKGLPKYFQVGTVVGGPADFYSGRLTKKEQKSSIADELLSDSSLTAYRKRKYIEIQDQKQAGGKLFWKKKKSKRTPAWARI